MFARLLQNQNRNSESLQNGDIRAYDREPVGTDMMPSQRNECMCECEPASQPADDDVDATTFPKSESYPNTPNLMRRLTKPPNEGEFVFVDVFLKSAKEKIVP